MVASLRRAMGQFGVLDAEPAQARSRWRSTTSSSAYRAGGGRSRRTDRRSRASGGALALMSERPTSWSVWQIAERALAMAL